MEINEGKPLKFSKICDLESGSVFFYDSRFWLLLEEVASNGSYKAANLRTGYVGLFKGGTTVTPRSDLHVTQK